MTDKTRFGATIALGGFFVIVDQVLKYAARTYPSPILWKSIVGWDYFNNAGIAFSIPLPQTLVIVLTPLLIAALVYGAVASRHPSVRIGFILLTCGALSNYADRLFFGATIDYLRIGTGIFNIADALIAIGLARIVFAKRL